MLQAGPDWPFCGQISDIWPYFRLVGRKIVWLAIWLFWPFFEGRLAENVFCWPFLKICLYFKAKLSATTPFLVVSSPVCAFHHV